MTENAVAVPMTKRSLIVRDSLAFLSLIAITVVLFAVTLFLFRSFMTHRVDLAMRWSERGRAALAANHPAEAVAAFRAALSYAPGEHSYELMLAQALGDAGRTEEAYNYFLELWEVHPGDGSINLQLARLAAKKHEVPGAINFYRGSIYGTWEGDGVARRRAVRLELAQYLTAQHQLEQARAELLVAGGNAPDTPSLDLTLGRMLEQAGAPSDALSFYRKALTLEPKNEQALRAAGRLAYRMGDYKTAAELLGRAPQQGGSADDAMLLANARRLLELVPTDSMPDRERVERILTLRSIARKRWDACGAKLPADPLGSRWSSAASKASKGSLLRDPDEQEETLRLAYDTELATAKACTPPAGDDALLLRLAQAAKAGTP